MNKEAKRKPTFFTSDWHLGHGKSIILDSRPFNSLEQMHETLIRNYNNTVPKDGICYFLGDIVTCSSELAYSIISRLNGTKVVILGNHDKGSNAMYNCGFDVVLNTATLYIANEKVTLSHCPLKGVYRENIEGMKGVLGTENWHGEYKQHAFTVTNEGQFHLHGHIHSPNSGKSQKILGRQYDVGVPANNYRPVSIGIIESWIVNTKNKEKELDKIK
jgi:calcineurin-like phosphoesterase family protein